MFTNSLIAFATETAATTAGMDTKASTISMLFSFGLLIIVFYFFLIRPQKKKEKEAKQLRDNLQIGDEVTIIETGGDRSKIRVKLWAISENNTVHDASEETVKESFKPKKEKKDKEAEKAEKSDKAE